MLDLGRMHIGAGSPTSSFCSFAHPYYSITLEREGTLGIFKSLIVFSYICIII